MQLYLLNYDTQRRVLGNVIVVMAGTYSTYHYVKHFFTYVNFISTNSNNFVMYINVIKSNT